MESWAFLKQLYGQHSLSTTCFNSSEREKIKTLVVFYSQTGNTKKVAEEIAKNLNADLDEIIDKDKRGEDAMFKKDIKIDFKKDPSTYDLVVIGSPVWAFHIPPYTKAYLQKNKFNKVAFFCTYGLLSAFLFPNMRKYSKKPLAKLKVHMKLLNKSDAKIKAFCSNLS